MEKRLSLSTLKSRGRNLGEWLNAAGLTGPGMELGVAYGEHAEEVLETWKGELLYLVDAWGMAQESPWQDPVASANLEHARIYCHGKLARFKPRFHEVRMTSDQAFRAGEIPQLDWCYIDGNHQLPQVQRDIENWWTKVKPGGLFGGHDYFDLGQVEFQCDVKAAVNRFVGEHNLSLHTTLEGDSSWWILKP